MTQINNLYRCIAQVHRCTPIITEIHTCMTRSRWWLSSKMTWARRSSMSAAIQQKHIKYRYISQTPKHWAVSTVVQLWIAESTLTTLNFHFHYAKPHIAHICHFIALVAVWHSALTLGRYSTLLAPRPLMQDWKSKGSLHKNMVRQITDIHSWKWLLWMSHSPMTSTFNNGTIFTVPLCLSNTEVYFSDLWTHWWVTVSLYSS